MSEPQPLSHEKILVVFSGLVLALLLAALDSTIVSTALPTIVGELGGLTRLAWVVTAYLLAQTIVTPLYGKLGDLYGRKPVIQVAIVIFLIGSALCGLAANMGQLIAFRALQGLGGGGLIVTTQAVVGDIVPPRDRGRYQGLFGGVFGLSSIAGPLVGGYFTTHLSWRWIFYINLPVGILALVVLAATLPSQSRRVTHAVDYVGAALLATLLSSLVLLTDLGGTSFPWASTPVLGLLALAIAALVLFLLSERRAKEPVLPLSLFRNATFAITSVIGFVVGFALFGSVTYLPLFLQVVKGASPTSSGMQMLPLMGGMLTTSIVTGQLISRSGKYKQFPILGTAVCTVGLFLLSRMSEHTTIGQALAIMLLLGAGLGLVMQVLVIAGQNAVDYRDLGVATSGATMFRLVGGSLGTASLGAIFAARLSGQLSRAAQSATLNGSTGPALGLSGLSPASIAALPPGVRSIYSSAFTNALSTVFLVASFIALAGFILSLMVPEIPLRRTIAKRAHDLDAETGQTFPDPGEREIVESMG